MINQEIMPEYSCPYCNHKLDGATSIKNPSARPVEGCPTICGYCAELSIFKDDGTLRKFTDKDSLADFDLVELQKVQNFAREVIAAMAEGDEVNV